MKIFLVGVSCVGKTAIGSRLAELVGYRFFDLDTAIEDFFNTPLEALQNKFLTVYSFRVEAAKALKHLTDNNNDGNYIIALSPSGLMAGYLNVIKKIDCLVIAIHDSPENILNRIVFYDKQSKPIQKNLNEQEKKRYLKEIKKDITYFGKSYKRANLHIDISGLDVEGSAKKIAEVVKSV